MSIPAQVSAMAKLRCAWTTAKPSPLVAANSSLITMRMIATESPCRRPAKICGLALGSTRWRSRAEPVMP